MKYEYNYRIFYMLFFSASITQVLIIFLFCCYKGSQQFYTHPFIYLGLFFYNILVGLIVNKRCYMNKLKRYFREMKKEKIKENEEFLRSRFPGLSNKYQSYIE